MYRLIALTPVLASEPPAFVPKALLEDLRFRDRDAKMIDRHGYEALVNMANSAIDQRTGVPAERPLLDKFRAYYSKTESTPSLEASTICNADVFEKLKKQGAITAETEKDSVCPLDEDPLPAPVTCPSDGTPFEPLTDTSSVASDYNRMLLEDCISCNAIAERIRSGKSITMDRFRGRFPSTAKENEIPIRTC